MAGKEGWGKDNVPFEKMTTGHLKKAYLHCQKMELKLFNNLNKFSVLQEKIEAEAARRGVTLRQYNSQYHKNKQKLKSSIKQSK